MYLCLKNNEHLYLFIYLSQKQKEMLRALQSGGKVIVKPRKTQSAGFWGALLASIGVSLTIETIRKKKRERCSKNRNN